MGYTQKKTYYNYPFTDNKLSTCFDILNLYSDQTRKLLNSFSGDFSNSHYLNFIKNTTKHRHAHLMLYCHQSRLVSLLYFSKFN